MLNNRLQPLGAAGDAVPHITIEYSQNLADHHDIDALVEAVHQAALDHGLPPPDGLRTRAVGRDIYRIADSDPQHAFVAIAIRIGPGRTTAEKASFVEAVLDAAEAQVAGEEGPLAIAWSAELTVIDDAFRINRNYVRAAMAGDRQ